MLTMNLLVSSCSAYNSLDDWLANQPGLHSIINASLKSRRVSHRKYLKDVREFDIQKYWTNYGHRNLSSDTEHDEFSDEYD